MRQYLTATIQALSESELDDIIDPYFLRGIKEKDPHPRIAVYSIGHDGEANFHLPGVGKKTVTWIQAAVQWVADSLRLGTAVFNRHDPTTNAHSGRVQIGEVVGKAVKRIGDRLNTLAAIYVYPEFQSRPLDVASIEAEIEYANDGQQAWPTAVHDVSGIALSSSDIDTPGFRGATLLGAVQAYVQASGAIQGEVNMNLSEVKQAIKESGWAPSQLFDVTDIVADPKVTAKVKEEHQHTLNANERLTRERDEAKTKVTQLENEKADATKRLQQTQVQSRGATVLDTILTERKLDVKASAYVKRGLKNFTSEATDETGLKADLGKFVDTAYTEYQELAKDVFGVAGNAAPGAQNQSPTQTPIPEAFRVPNYEEPGVQSPSHPPKFVTQDMKLQEEMNPALNPLIPGGKAAQEALRT